MKRKLFIVALAFVIVLAIVFGFKAVKTMIIQHFVTRALPTHTQITAAKVVASIWEPQLHSVGSARARQSVDIAPEVGGRVTEILFKSGDVAKKDQLLVQLNSDVLNAQLASAQAKYELTRVTYERQLELLRQRVGQQQAVDQAFADMDQARASIEQTKAQLAQLQLKAPFDGVLGLRYVDVGEYVTAGQKLVNLQLIRPMDVDFAIPENQLGQLSVGQEVTVKTLTYDDQVFSGKIVAFDSQVGTTSRALMVRASFANEKSLLMPNMFLDVTVHLPGGQRMLQVPQSAINYSQIGNFVYVVVNDTASKRYVELGERRADVVAVIKGLQEGDIVVTTGQLKLHDGTPVAIQEAKSNDMQPETLSP